MCDTQLVAVPCLHSPSELCFTVWAHCLCLCLLRKPYIVRLDAMSSSLTGAAGLQGAVTDMAFLHSYFQPTLAVLQVLGAVVGVAAVCVHEWIHVRCAQTICLVLACRSLWVKGMHSSTSTSTTSACWSELHVTHKHHGKWPSRSHINTPCSLYIVSAGCPRFSLFLLCAVFFLCSCSLSVSVSVRCRNLCGRRRRDVLCIVVTSVCRRCRWTWTSMPTLLFGYDYANGAREAAITTH